MRNVFDQYSQPENRLTHALACTLEHDRDLLRPFLRWLKIPDVPPARSLGVVEQQVPGTYQPSEDGEQGGLPDLCIFDEDGWAVLFESKVQAKIAPGQLKRHRQTAQRYGYEAPHLVVISVGGYSGQLPKGARHVQWRELFAWFRARCDRSFWARQLVEYMQRFETRMLAEEYGIRGTITMFDGLRFDEDNPYTYREGKRLIRLLGDELQKRSDLKGIGVDPKGQRRPAITGRGGARVWDFLPLKVARGATNFTAFPHLTLGIGHEMTDAAITVPNGVRGGFRSKLREKGVDGFHGLLSKIARRVERVHRQASGSRTMAYVLQRHYPSQSSAGIIDGVIKADIRTIRPGSDGGVKHQPQWVDAMYELLVNKRSNLQFGIETQFFYHASKVRSPKAVDLYAEAWKAKAPLLEFVLRDQSNRRPNR